VPATEIILGLLSVLLGWFWLDSLRVREAAVAAARAACESEGLMLLDDTVAIVAIKPVRNDAGHVTLQRTYNFEYSDTGDNRRIGSLVLQGRCVVLFNIGLHTPAMHRMLD
jgi:hypothetical protein